ncbi:MAG: MoaD/ThiS family protein [Microcoleaceae cyanobacterium]
MAIKVNYLAQIKQIVGGVDSEIIQLETPCSVKQLVNKLVENHGDSLQNVLLDSSGNLRSTILLVIGDAQISWNSSVEIEEGDEISLLSPLAGG